ncbi:MAG: transposase, IS4 family protein [Promethearchaeota archaeon CR_4]|nr:MAG: transposase, IS4 family protein [Candidatus Lokiarchaeota archaeon CR_4]
MVAQEIGRRDEDPPRVVEVAPVGQRGHQRSPRARAHDRGVGDQATFVPLVQECLDNGIEVTRGLGDGIFDMKTIFNYLSKNHIAPGIRPRKNASRCSRGSPSRAEEVRYLQDYGYKRWRDSRQDQKRYAVERTYSVFKGRFGEATMALKWENQDHEVDGKLALLNWDLTRPLMPL